MSKNFLAQIKELLTYDWDLIASLSNSSFRLYGVDYEFMCFVTNNTLTISSVSIRGMYKDINPFMLDISPVNTVYYIIGNDSKSYKNIVPTSDFHNKDLLLMTLEIENGSFLHGIHTELLELFLEHLRDIKENQS